MLLALFRCCRPRLAAALLALAPLLAGAAPPVHTLTVSAAVSLAEAMREIAAAFEARQPAVRLRLNLGASGALLQQAARGAPVDVLASADEATLDEAVQRGLVAADQRRVFARNRLVVVVPAGSALALRTLGDLAQPAVQRLALGVPASVPAGRYARQALRDAGIWPAVQPRMIGAQSVRQVLDYVARNEVDAGIVYATDASLMPQKVRVALADPAPALPVRYALAPLRASREPGLARRFVEFMLQPEAQAILARHGFLAPA